MAGSAFNYAPKNGFDDPDCDEKTTLYTNKWKEKPCCIWEIRDHKDGTVCILSNADIELGLKPHRSKGVAVGKFLLKEGRWKLERQKEL